MKCNLALARGESSGLGCPFVGRRGKVCSWDGEAEEARSHREPGWLLLVVWRVGEALSAAAASEKGHSSLCTDCHHPTHFDATHSSSSSQPGLPEARYGDCTMVVLLSAQSCLGQVPSPRPGSAWFIAPECNHLHVSVTTR